VSGLIGLVKRSDELDRLHGLFESGNAQLAVVYGRGRLGKPSLVKKTLEDRENAPIVDVGQWWYQDHEIDVVRVRAFLCVRIGVVDDIRVFVVGVSLCRVFDVGCGRLFPCVRIRVLVLGVSAG
jgi:AAA+ ATPase superfamily predicted ATPase